MAKITKTTKLPNKHKNSIKGFHHLSKAWYGEANLKHHDYIDQISFGFYSEEGGTTGYCNISWYQLEGDKLPSAKLSAYYDAFDVPYATGVMDELQKYVDVPIQPNEFITILKKLGFKDLTEHEMQN